MVFKSINQSQSNPYIIGKIKSNPAWIYKQNILTLHEPAGI